MQLIKTEDWHFTASGEPRGFIQPHQLSELWFHVGTACNLSCPFCLEGSKPGDDRLQAMSVNDVMPYVRTGLELGVERFCFTGGEPFVIRSFVEILDLAADYKPCLVLTNGTKPLLRRLHQLKSLQGKDIHFRISIDYPTESEHEAGRGTGTFAESLRCIKELKALGFDVSVARQMKKDEDKNEIERQYQNVFSLNNLPSDIHLVAFPDFLPPGKEAANPDITENCMTQYQTEETRKKFMCAYTKMLVKQDGEMRVYACTLVDDNIGYCLGSDLKKSMAEKILLKHHRCFSCFAYGSSCSG